MTADVICRCALEKGRMFHRGDCPLYPGEPLRITAAQFRERAGLSADAVWDSRQILGTGELALFLGGSPDSFTGLLLELIAKADPESRGRLKIAFPRQVLAWEQWQSCSPAPTFAQMRDLMAGVEPRAARIEQMMQRFVLGAA